MWPEPPAFLLMSVLIVRPFDSLLKAKALWGMEAGSGEVKSKGLSPKFEESPIVSG